ncbi:hypothetical protein L2D36_25290 [Vibrio harveyi]|uniref:hypothetical protein n=1 Tax=Vibrio TaxID=662 RepID=UPI001D90EE70|nr:hypothetical protein [Vibrio sp. NFR]EGQ8499050.1 hypothetical protein [Vibrio alginolyticus]ELB1501454.1 hypothetical protein [Vibrio alginolyticus]ELC9557950.1 hypothetical protein [Vibrio alginolyticus]MDA0135815.1 hypothetical protein [Vibrio sp. NFR]
MSREPKPVENEIFDILNGCIDSGRTLSEIEIQQLIRKANQLRAPLKYVCLSALYSHSAKYQLAIDTVNRCLRSNFYEPQCVSNMVSALKNARLFKSVVDISKEFPYILEHSKVMSDVYDSALYTLDLEYCSYISDKYVLTHDDDYLSHDKIYDYFERNEEIVSRASSYFNYVFSTLTEILAEAKARSSSIQFGLCNLGDYASLELAVQVKGSDFESVFDMESSWTKRLAQYEIVDDKLCDISFAMEVKS